jgi:hypothetical protein
LIGVFKAPPMVQEILVNSDPKRFFIPPYMDPIEPNIDPILMAGVAQMGKSMERPVAGSPRQVP